MSVPRDRWQERAAPEELARWLADGLEVLLIVYRVEDLPPIIGAVAAILDPLELGAVVRVRPSSQGIAIDGGGRLLTAIGGEHLAGYRPDRVVGPWRAAVSTGVIR